MCKKIPLIAISNRNLCQRPFLEQIQRVCKRNPYMLILREKDLSPEAYLELLLQVKKITDASGITLVPHTFWKEAKEAGFTKIHLPLPVLKEHSKELSSFEEIGTSVHSIEDAKEALQLGATYLTAGHIYLTDCKKGLPGRGISFLTEVCKTVPIPVYAIGGIKDDTQILNEIKNAGAKGACIMSGFMHI